MVTYLTYGDLVVSQGGLLGWDVFLNSLFRVGFTRGFSPCCFSGYFVVSQVTLLFLRGRADGRADGLVMNYVFNSILNN